MLLGTLLLLVLHDALACSSCLCACAERRTSLRPVSGWNVTSPIVLSPTDCVEFKDQILKVDNIDWGMVTRRDQMGWVALRDVRLQPCPANQNLRRGDTRTRSPDCPRIISRAEWGARAPKQPFQHLMSRPRNLYIHHGAQGSCSSQESCAQLARKYQKYHIDFNGWNDLGYNFLVGEDGGVYEGRGWGVQGAHTYGHNTDGLGVCMMGNLQDRLPNHAALQALTRLINCAVASGKIRTDYHLVAHRDVRATNCPGQAFYDLLKTWPHYNSQPL